MPTTDIQTARAGERESHRMRAPRARFSMRVLKFRIIDDIRYNAITTYKSKLLYTRNDGKKRVEEVASRKRKKTRWSQKKEIYTPFEGISSSLLWSIFNFQRVTRDYERVLLHFCNLLEKVKFMGDFSPWLLMFVRAFVWYNKPPTAARKKRRCDILNIFIFVAIDSFFQPCYRACIWHRKVILFDSFNEIFLSSIFTKN